MNYKKIAKAYYEDAELALASLVSIPSVEDPSTKKEGAPFGENVKKALDYVAFLGEQYGFKVDKCDGYCTELSYGDKGPLIGIYAHADVVPSTGEWKSDPFKMEKRDGYYYGRGTTDDKGPLIASLYALKALKDHGLIRNFRVRLVAGGNEESGSECLKYYFGKLNKPANDYGFTPDADFPCVRAEKGSRIVNASRLVDLKPVTKMEGGIVPNAVCDRLNVYLPKDEGFLKFLTDSKIEHLEEGEGSDYHIVFLGKSSHGSRPEDGVNAALLAFSALGSYYKLGYLEQLANYLSEPHGKNFDGYSKGKELGESTYNYGIFSYDGKVLKFSIDYRFSEEADPDLALENFEKATRMTTTPLSEPHHLLLFKEDHPLVKTIMKAYRKATHDYFSKPLCIGGGTYAKNAPNTIAFGPARKGRLGDIHSPNEYLYIKDFHDLIAIYMRAIMMLGAL